MPPENADNTTPQPLVPPSQPVGTDQPQPLQAQNIIPSQPPPTILPNTPGSSKKKVIIVALLAVLFLVILIIVSLFIFSRRPASPIKQSGATKDKVDQQTTSTENYQFIALKAVGSKFEKSKLITFNSDFSSKKEEEYSPTTNKINGNVTKPFLTI